MVSDGLYRMHDCVPVVSDWTGLDRAAVKAVRTATARLKGEK